MQAIYFNQHGDSSVLKYADLPEPQAQPGEVILKVHAVALNHLDIWVRRGWPGLNLTLPHIGGSDIVGEVLTDGKSFKAGDLVAVFPGINSTQDEWTTNGQNCLSPGYKIIGEHLPGGMAEYVAVPETNLLSAPKELSPELLAASCLVGLTSWRMLFQRAQLKQNETILIVGSGGGVNLMSLLMAQVLQCRVLVLAGGSDKVKLIKKLAAVEVIDYLAVPEWHKAVMQLTNGRGVDLVVDNAGSRTFPLSLKSLCRGGRLVTVGNTTGYKLELDNRLIFGKQLSIIGSTMGNLDDLKAALQFIIQHKCFIPIDLVTGLSQGIHQLERLERGEQFGKIVLTPGS